MDLATRDLLIAQFRRQVLAASGITLFTHQAEWHCASEGWTLLDAEPIPGDYYRELLVPLASLRPTAAIVRTATINNIPCAYVRRTIVHRPGGAAHILADLAAYKAGKSFGTGAWLAGFGVVPGKIHLIGSEYATSEPEFNYLADFLLSERGMNMRATTFHNDRRAGRMRIVLPTGADFEVKSWERKEGLKGKKVLCYCFCLPLNAPIWMGDFSFKRLSDVKVGDVVIGMSRKPHVSRRGGRRIHKKRPRRCLVRSKVTAIHRTRDTILRLRFKSGRVAYCTPDHRWLSARTIGVQRYVKPRLGAKFVHVVDEPDDPPRKTEWIRGYLAGIYDGEGSRTMIAQYKSANPATHKRIADALRSLGFETVEVDTGVRWNGGQEAALKFLTWTQAPRYKEKWADEAILTSRFGTDDEIIDIQDMGEREVGCISTETENFVAYGFLTHNCEAYQLPGLEVYTTLSQNLREERGFALFPTTADHPWVGVFHDYGHGHDPDWHCSCSIDAACNPFTYDQRARDRDDPAKGGIMTKERFAISWQGRLGAFIGRVYDVQRGDPRRIFTPASHPFLWNKRTLEADALAR
jgi:hypothetical protein